jgi:hypothetical protein
METDACPENTGAAYCGAVNFDSKKPVDPAFSF